MEAPLFSKTVKFAANKAGQVKAAVRVLYCGMRKMWRRKWLYLVTFIYVTTLYLEYDSTAQFVVLSAVLCVFLAVNYAKKPEQAE